MPSDPRRTPEWELHLEAEEMQPRSESWPKMRYDGVGYRWRRFLARLHYIRWGFRMASDLPPWVGAREK